MALSGKTAERFVVFVLYAGIFAFTSWGGVKLINYSLESKYYNDFLLKWEVSLRTFDAGGGTWPHFNGGNHSEYMENLVRVIQKRNISLPASNTKHPYVRRINKIGWDKEEDTFLLCFSNRIIIYGISKETLNRIDAYIDTGGNPEQERFTGYISKDGKSYIGLWRL
jgi:hypothetical protein